MRILPGKNPIAPQEYVHTVCLISFLQDTGTRFTITSRTPSALIEAFAIEARENVSASPGGLELRVSKVSTFTSFFLLSKTHLYIKHSQHSASNRAKELEYAKATSRSRWTPVKLARDSSVIPWQRRKFDITEVGIPVLCLE